MQLAVEASQRSHFFVPLVAAGKPRFLTALFPLYQPAQPLLNGLIARAMQRIHAGEFELAINDSSAAHRLARLIGQGHSLIDELTAVAFEVRACAADVQLSQSEAVGANRLRAYLATLDTLTPIAPMAERMDLSERLIHLDLIQCLSRFGPGPLISWLEPSANGLLDVPYQLVDWNLVLKSGNEVIDRAVAAGRKPTFRERLSAVHSLQQETLRLRSSSMIGVPNDGNLRNHLSRHMSYRLAYLSVSKVDQLVIAEDRCGMRFDLTRIALALGIWRAEHGAYPGTLAELVPSVLPSIPEDRFSDGPLHYEPRPDGYRLYSLGQGKGNAPPPEGENLFVQVP